MNLRPAPYNEISYRKIFRAINRYTLQTLNATRSRRRRCD